jgi:hypothetical protein
VQIVPLRLVFAVAVEHLHAVVLAVGDIDPAVGVGAMLCTMLNWPGSVPGSPQVFISLPSGVYLWTQALP